jgi:curved DNA-binding protein CbpA
MPDYFELFRLTRSPVLDLEALKQKFLELSSLFHPDKAPSADLVSAQTKRFAELNEGYKILQNPKTRLLHLLELEGFGAQERFQSVSPEIADLFAETSQAAKKCEQLMNARRLATSPMTKASFYGAELEMTDEIQTLQTKLKDRMAQVEASILDRWESSHATDGKLDCDRNALFAYLHSKAVEFGFLQRMMSQLEEKLASMAF